MRGGGAWREREAVVRGVISVDRRDMADRLAVPGWMSVPGWRRPWRRTAQRLSRRLLSCSCLTAEERDPLERDPLGPQETSSTEVPRGREHVHVTVEDLGEVNLSFSLAGEAGEAGEEGPAWTCSVTRSASSLSTCHKGLSKKRLRALSSLPLQDRTDRASEGDEEEEDPVLFEADSPPASNVPE